MKWPTPSNSCSSTSYNICMTVFDEVFFIKAFCHEEVLKSRVYFKDIFSLHIFC